MLYLNEKHIDEIGINWEQIIDSIEDSTKSLENGDFSQPVKPYLRYRDLTNRIIAMPAFLGGNTDLAGIKWIASFPKNIDKNLNRANSVTILNESGTGIPRCIINTTKVSGIRTAAVTGYVLREVLNKKGYSENVNIGITGFGPIGQLHLDMIEDLLGNRINQVSIFDIRNVDTKHISESIKSKVKICKSWEEAYIDADIFITCTVSDKPYIDKKPKVGSIHLNVSLRDYVADYRDFVDVMLVDDWDEICRESTDIEMMHKLKNLQKEDTKSLIDIANKSAFDKLKDDDIVMFNPMGLAIYDIAVGKHYYQTATTKEIGQFLDD